MTLEEIKHDCPNVDISNKAFKLIIEFKKIETEKQRVQLIEQVKNYSLVDEENSRHLWILLAEMNDSSWRCIEVGSSNDIKGEICSDIDCMAHNRSDTSKGGFLHKGKEIYKAYTYADKVSCKYRYINENFDHFMWFEVEIDKFLEGINTGIHDRVSYAEVKCAVDYKALLWNPVSKEWTILKEVYPNEYNGG